MTNGPQKIGAYPVEREIGRGGMGIVYLARDPRLHRQVAIKTLPDAFAKDPERLARSEREARLLASLNHPNIAAIYGLEESDGHRHLVLEYVEGETLAERLGRGPLPIGEAIEVCRQIAAALEAAHESGVIHRDLKPGNVKLTPGGEVKVLDFGLAKGGATESSPDLSQSPTIAYNMTGAGVILGTAAYMSPEQARGKSVDRRTDIWSFGCVLYECLTGRQLFSGETVSDMIAKILEREPDWNALPAQTPEKVRELLRRMLEKDSKKRLRDIGDARIELEETLAARASSARMTVAPVAAAAPAGRLGGRWVPWAVAALALAVAAASWLLPGTMRGGGEKRVVRFPVLGTASSVIIEDAAMSAISPDGRKLAFVASDSAGNVFIWTRSLDALNARPIPGTDNVELPFWSPDSRWIGFFADGKLKKVPADGGEIEVVCDARNGRGGTWNRGDVIVFAPDGAGPLFQVSAAGGEAKPVTTLDSTRRESAHRFPSFLPDGKHYLFGALSMRAGGHEIWLGTLGSAERTLLTSATSTPVYAPPGYLIYARGRGLVAQRFDLGAKKVVGPPITLPDLPAPSQYNAYRAASVSDHGEIAYVNGRVQNTQLTWLDRAGNPQGVVPMPPGRYDSVNLSFDGKQVAAVRSESPSETDLWLIDLERSAATRFTFSPGRDDFPLWSPDGRRIAFQSNRSGAGAYFVKPTNGAAPETTLYAPGGVNNLTGWSPEGRTIFFEQLDPRTGWDLYALPADGSGPPAPVRRTPLNERWLGPSPDGRWIAYTSDESGRQEIYVESYPEPKERYRVSTAGGVVPWWRADSRELLFFSPDLGTVLSSELTTAPAFRSSPPRTLFRMPSGAQFGSPTPDLQRFLVPLPVGDKTPASITVVQNWTAGLAKR